MSQITVYTARQIHTMNPSLPQATAVACRDGMIIDTGTLESMQPWLDAHPHRIDKQFADKVMLPGLIDPHLHPTLAAMLLPCHFITTMTWNLPHAKSEAVKGHDDYVRRLREIEGGLSDPKEPLITWGYHKIWHGEVNRELLNQVSSSRPIVVWQRSFHEIITNDAAIDWMKLDRDALNSHPQVELETGRFYETGQAIAMGAMNNYLLSDERLAHGLSLTCDVIHKGGHTTIGDMAYPMSDAPREWNALTAAIEKDDIPFRMQIVPRAMPKMPGFGASSVDELEAQLAAVKQFPEQNTHRLQFRNGVKIFTDGGFFAELMQLQPPGFIDGHHGEWLMPPDVVEKLARVYWNAGYRIHIHCTGDLGVELALDVLEKLQFERPRVNHRFTIEHCGVSTPEQVRRMADLGAIASVNVYYLHELGEAYWQHSIGFERASQMARLGTMVREGLTFALHTDFTMAPAEPLNSAWVAVNRFSESGSVLGANERVSLARALQAVTLDAAYVLGMENEVGSIRAGKKADFTVLDADPFETPVDQLKDIPIHATVFEGTPALIK